MTVPGVSLEIVERGAGCSLLWFHGEKVPIRDRLSALPVAAPLLRGSRGGGLADPGPGPRHAPPG